MKIYSIILVIVCITLGVALIIVKRGDNAQHDTDTATITTFSNQLDTAQLDLSTYRGSLIICSNNLDQSRSVAAELSNHLAEAQIALVRDADQMTNLTQQIAAAMAANQTLDQRLASLTNHIATLTQKLAATGARLSATNNALAEAQQQFSRLENRFRRDVAARVVAERKFSDVRELQAQLQNLKHNPAQAVSAESIYAGLDVVVKSDGSFHVISPN